MHPHPEEYMFHPVPVMGVYGLPDEPSLLDTKLEDSNTQKNLAISSKVGLATSLLHLLTKKTDYSLYEATAYLTHPQAPPPFRVITVSKDYTLPQRQTTHSNLSPLSVDSPVYPDGLMTPLWVKKHMYYPSTVVGFYELWDWHTETGENPKRETGPLASQILIDPTEKEHDMSLATEINVRRKYFQDKGIKFAVVILLKQKYADTSIEERLSSIKKQCGLDYKSSFFTVAPSSADELQDFVNNLFRVLYEPATQLYSNRIKKIRKKRSKLPSPSLPRTDLSTTDPLSATGWLLRYDMKTAHFQEYKQEIEGALKSYEAAYHSLTTLLSPTPSPGNPLVVVNSKRWNEARVLADCLNIKICKLYLYMNDPAIALAQLNGHLHMFQSYSPSWGIGEQTYEYWACLSKQYQLFADTIDSAVQAGYKIPIPTEYLTEASPSSPSIGNVAISSTTGCNPGAILQHPGFYYHLAAMCCAERRRRFLDCERTAPESDGLLAEKRIDHSSLTIDLLTKSYEQFKRYRNSRMTLYLAAEIAGMYYETGKYDMAIKFFERIGKTYRKEKWNMVLTSILRWSLRCAKELKSWEKAIECLVELMSDELPMTVNKRNDIQRELLDMLDGKDIERAPLVIHMDQITSFLECHVQIKNRTNFVGSRVEYQITLKTNKSSPPVPLRLSAIRVIFNDPQYNVILKDIDMQSEMNSSELIDFSKNMAQVTEEGKHFNWFSAQCDLRVVKGQTKVLQGCVIPQKCTELRITAISFVLSSQCQVELNYTIDQAAENQFIGRRKWLESISESNGKPIFKLLDGRGGLSSTNIMQKPPSIDITYDHNAPALLDELFKLDIIVKNTETEAIHATLFAEIKNAEGIVKEDYITFTDNENKEEHSVTKELDLDIIDAGQSIIKTAYLHGANTSGSRIVNLTVKYTVNGRDFSEVVEKTDTIRIPFIAPFDATFDLCALTEKLEKSIDIDLEKSEKWLLTTSLRCFSAWDLEIKSVKLEQDKTFSHPITSLSLLSSMEDLDITTWKTGHAYNSSYLFRLHTTDLMEQQPTVPVGSIAIAWRRSGVNEDYCQSIIALPTLQLQQQGLVVVADIPDEIYLSEPFTLSYTIYNPTEHIVEYTGSIEVSDAFIFSGYKQVKSTVLPLSRKVYYYNCYPMQAGKVKLPKLKVGATRQQGGDQEISVMMVGTGPTFTLNNDLQLRQSSPADTTQLPTLTFVHAKRKL